jgi:CheY-like chemotaxis protein
MGHRRQRNRNRPALPAPVAWRGPPGRTGRGGHEAGWGVRGMGGRSARVLVVGDDEATRAVLAPALREEGHAVREAGDAAAGLAILRAWRPDAVLLDVGLPGPDGWAFRRAQRAMPGAAGVPVVVVSAGHRVVAPSPELIPAAVLAKPFDVEALLDTFDRVTAGRGDQSAA